MKKSMLFAVLAILGTAPVLAGTPRLNEREANQHARIHQGVESGSLTKPEARRLPDDWYARFCGYATWSGFWPSALIARK